MSHFKRFNMRPLKILYLGLKVEFEMMADTELKKMEETPSLRDKDYRTLLENIPILIVRYDTSCADLCESCLGKSARPVLRRCHK